MFCDFRHVWQDDATGCKFRMFILDEKLKMPEYLQKLNLFSQLTGMNPDKPQTLACLFACNSNNKTERRANKKFANDVRKKIIKNALTK